jgi:hypothetical protein
MTQTSKTVVRLPHLSIAAARSNNCTFAALSWHTFKIAAQLPDTTPTTRTLRRLSVGQFTRKLGD